MKLRPIRLQPNELEELKLYASELGYELKESSGIWILQSLETGKKVFLQRSEQKLIAVSDEAIINDLTSMETSVMEYTEDLDTNLRLFKAMASNNLALRQGIGMMFSKLLPGNRKEILRNVVGIVSLQFIQTR